MHETRQCATAEAPVNIALLKYWGKRDAQLNLPTNSSFSVVLQSEEGDASAMRLVTRTSVAISDADTFVLNGAPVAPVTDRMARVLKYVRGIRELHGVRVESANLFPTAAGLASSASGSAALVKALSALVGLAPEQESTAARLGSGSACRSLPDGFVEWRRGERADGEDCVAVSVFPAEHWPALRCLVFVFSPREKPVPSGVGMERTVQTSALFAGRLEGVEGRISQLKEAIGRRCFASFAEIVMRDSNQFHAVCLDAYPPIFYLDALSQTVIGAVHGLNANAVTAAYTFDAGPNAFVFCLDPDVAVVRRAICEALSKLNVDMDGQVIKCRVGRGAHII